jgi:DNA-binding beta-propeller fold protein YncE
MRLHCEGDAVPTINGLDLTMSLDAKGVITARIDYTLEFSPEEAAANISIAEKAVLARRYGGLDLYTAQAAGAAGMQLLAGQAAGDQADQVVAVLQDQTAGFDSFGIAAGAPPSVTRSFTHTLTDTERTALLEVGREHPYALVSVLPAGIRADVQIAQVEIDVGDPAGVPQPAGDFPVGTAPRAVAFDGHSVWVANSGGENVTKLSLDGTPQGPFAAGKVPSAIAVEPMTGAVWVAASGDQAIAVLMQNGTLANIVPTVGSPTALAAGTAVWVATDAGNLEKHDPVTGGTLQTVPLPGKTPSAVCFSDGNIWVADEQAGTVARVRAEDGTLVGSYPVGAQPLALAFDGECIWVANNGEATVTKLRAADGANLGAFPVGANPTGVVAANGMVWVANGGDRTVTRLRASDGGADQTIDVGPGPSSIAYDGQSIWVTRESANSVARRPA